MNVVEIVVILLFAAIVLDGYRAGFVKTLFSIIKISIGVAIAVICSCGLAGKVTEPVKEMVPGVFLVVFAVVFGLLGALERLFNLIDLIPVAKQINRLTGLAAGTVKFVILVWAVFWMTGYFADIEWVIKLNELFQDSKILLFINDYNPLHLLIK